MKYLLSIILFSISLLTFAQKPTRLERRTPTAKHSTKTLESFIYLYNGDIVKVQEINYEAGGLFKKGYLLADGERYEVKDVKFYSKGNNYFANGSDYSTKDFIERYRKGKINLYRTFYSTTSTTTSQGGMSTTRNGTKVDYLYNVGYGDLKKLKYRNLKIDLVSSPEAMVHLNKYKRSRNIKRGLLIGGLAAMFSTVLYVEEAQPLAFGAATLGGASVLTGLFWGIGRDRHLYKAVETYNGFSIW